MAGHMNDMQDKFGTPSEMKAKFEELKSKEQTGELDDKGRSELQQLKAHFDNHDK